MLVRRLIAAALVLALCGILSSCTHATAPNKAPSAAPADASVVVDVIPVRIATLDDDIVAVGNFKAVTEANISPKTGGLVVSVPVRMGQRVQAGETLVQLDTTDILAQLAQDRADIEAEQTKLGLVGLHATLRNDVDAPAVRKARANLENTRLSWERSRNLYRADLIAQKDLQDAKAQFLAAQADYQTAIENVQTNKANVTYKRTQLALDEQKLRNATVIAPFTGFIASRNVNPGDFIQPGGSAGGGAEYMKLVTLDPIYCQMQIAEVFSQRLKPGQALRIKTVAWPDKVFNGHVAHVSPSLDPATRTVKVDATIGNPERLLKPGLYGNVKLTLGQLRNVRMVPQVSQVEQAGVTRVYLIEQKNGKTVVRSVQIQRGVLDGAWVQAEGDGVVPGTQVVVTNTDRLYDGVEVKIGKVLTEPPNVQKSGL